MPRDGASQPLEKDAPTALGRLAAEKRRRDADPAAREAFFAARATSLAPVRDEGKASSRSDREATDRARCYALRRAGALPPGPAPRTAPVDRSIFFIDLIAPVVPLAAVMLALTGALASDMAAPSSALAAGGAFASVVLVFVAFFGPLAIATLALDRRRRR